MFGISVKFISGRYQKMEFEDFSRHEVKSLAGKQFHNDEVKSVCVFDENGKSHLYLRKDADGKIHREVSE